MNLADQVIWLCKSRRIGCARRSPGCCGSASACRTAEGSRVDVMIPGPRRSDDDPERGGGSRASRRPGVPVRRGRRVLYFRDSAWMAERRAREVDAWETAGISRRRA